MKRLFLTILLIIIGTFMFSKNVFLQWRPMENEYYFEQNGITYIDFKYIAHKLNKEFKIENDSLIYFKSEKSKTFIFLNEKVAVVDQDEVIKINDEEFIVNENNIYTTANIISKLLNLELLESSVAYYLNIPLSNINSINTYFTEDTAKTEIDLSEEAIVEVYSLVNSMGYLIKIKGAELPNSYYYKEFNSKIRYIKAYHYSQTEVWVKILFRSKAKMKKTIKDKKIVMEFKFDEVDMPVLVIDPGHGGWDPGMIGPNSTKEKDFTLKVAKEVLNLLAEYDIDVYLTREKDEYIGLYERAAYSNDKNADLFLSIHLNSFPDIPSVRGSEVYYYDFSSAKYRSLITWKMKYDSKKDKATIDDWVSVKKDSIKESKKFAIELENNLLDKDFKSRGTKPETYAVLSYTRSPAVLFELEFLSNPDVEKKFLNGDYVDDFAEIIKKSILDYFNIKEAN